MFYLILLLRVSLSITLAISRRNEFSNHHSIFSRCDSSCSNGLNCHLRECEDCEFSCGDICIESTHQCDSSCIPSECGVLSSCSGCTFCDTSKNSACPLATFIDVTNYKLPKTDPHWQQWEHSGRPYSNEGSPLFFDLNGDGVLDFFNSMHAHPIDENNGYNNRMELGESVPYNFIADGVMPSEENSDPSIMRFRSVSYRIIINDVLLQDLDTHGQNVVDLDGDGILDIMIASGGGRGGSLTMFSQSRDNLLFWGEKGVDNITGESVTIFRGGRDTARDAGVQMHYGRGRVNYMLDVNNDGLLDIFCMQDRRKTDEITPGILLINQGDRTWKEDPTMSEYTRTMILTDADGDGYAQEIILNRGFCFPQRDGPETDPDNPELGPFHQSTIQFCSTRPVGTNAIFKYNNITQKMEEISKKYSNVSPDRDKQPPCCPHGTWSSDKDCHAKSMASGDFDGDLRSDLVMLYKSKIVFYFSSDRPVGSLPSENQHVGAEVSLPCHGESLRVIDLDNNGVEEILVMCNQAANFLVYTRGQSMRDWILDEDCNHRGSLGALVDYTLAGFTNQDFIDSCKEAGKSDWKKLQEACDYWQNGGEKPHLDTVGISTVDLNNDGFMDTVVTYDLGYTRYFHNVPSDEAKMNEFIVFKLVGGGISNNKYGIGATAILYIVRGGRQISTQFREVSSYQHTTDKYGNKEDRLIFGLGVGAKPSKLVIRWPDGFEQTVSLQNWSFRVDQKPIEVEEVLPTAQPSESPSMTPSRNPTSYPTAKPTYFPSVQPSSYPSNTPSNNPSDAPSSTPSLSPSMMPSETPSMGPSASPSMSPSLSPSSFPTGSPTESPSASPSFSPSSFPTVSPTESPSVSPSLSPSSFPTNGPTESPSVSPSLSPSASPTTSPTGTPSVSPTETPSVSPTGRPSANPSLSPSSIPTMSPTGSPSVNPSLSPSSFPTKSPTFTPSVAPSDVILCKDSQYPFRYKGARRTCSDFRKEQNKPECRIEWISDRCPFSCGLCTSARGPTQTLVPSQQPQSTQCADSIQKVYINKKVGTKYCSFIATNTKYCSWSKIRAKCPVTCSSCPCTDSKGEVWINSRYKRRDCPYIALHKFKLCRWGKVATFCPLTCGTCPCTDNEGRVWINKMMGLQNCAFIAKNTRFCSWKKVGSHCPKSCGLCR